MTHHGMPALPRSRGGQRTLTRAEFKVLEAVRRSSPTGAHLTGVEARHATALEQLGLVKRVTSRGRGAFYRAVRA